VLKIYQRETKQKKRGQVADFFRYALKHMTHTFCYRAFNFLSE